VFENTDVSICATCSHNSQVWRECALVRNKHVKPNNSTDYCCLKWHKVAA